MKEKPIIFSTPMVQAILAGNKTMTRRVIKPQPERKLTKYIFLGDSFFRDDDLNLDEVPWGNYKEAPYQVGDHLWCKETYCPDADNRPIYRADCDSSVIRWKPSIFMPKWAARIWLEVTAVRVERVQEITEEDAKAEGLSMILGNMDRPSTRWYFKNLWDSINAKRKPTKYDIEYQSEIGTICPYAWASNPWVWVYSFRRTN